MTDEKIYEEMEKEAKEYSQGNFYSEQGFLYGYERGYAEGRKEKWHDLRKEKWHDLRKDPNDLPEHSGLYCVQCGEVREYVKEEKSWFTVHFEPCMNCTEETYLWCELTKFEE